MNHVEAAQRLLDLDAVRRGRGPASRTWVLNKLDHANYNPRPDVREAARADLIRVATGIH